LQPAITTRAGTVVGYGLVSNGLASWRTHKLGETESFGQRLLDAHAHPEANADDHALPEVDAA
jgi:hypothetical protein